MQRTAKAFLALLLSFSIAISLLPITAISTQAAEGSYYSSITADGGQELLGQLHDLMCSTHNTYTTYDGDCRNASVVSKTDPGSKEGTVMEFYSQADIDASWGAGKSGTWNREHCWCQSLSNGLWGTKGGGSDLHHIRPVESALNSTRNNNLYGEISNRDSYKVYYKDANKVQIAHGGYCSGGVYEPLDTVKGDVARIVMYVYMHYNTYSRVGGTKDDSKCTTFGELHFDYVIKASNEQAAIDMLLDWNESDPVSESEITRNEEVYKIQGNRNPFIDHPEYADAIWGNATSGGTSELRSLSLTPNEVELGVGQSKKLTVSATPSTASKSVSWQTSNDSVVTVTNGTVTAIGVGSATITATSTANPMIKATAHVEVKSQSSESIKITRDSFDVKGSKYGFECFTQDGVSGIAYLYPNKTSSMQFNNSQASYYIALTSPTPARITSVKAVLDSETTTAKNWKLLTSDTPYGEVAKKPTTGKDWGTKSVTVDGATWSVSGEYTYFALTYEDLKACYLKSVEVSYFNGEEDPSTPAIALESLTISSSQKTCEIGDKFNLHVTGTPAAADSTVEWSSSDSSVATVTAGGEVQAIGEGTAKITATSVNFPAITAVCTVTVNAAPVPSTPVDPQVEISSLALNYSTMKCEVGDSFKLYATASPAGADSSVEWSSSDDTKATVSGGQVIAKAAGTVTITATSTVNPQIKAVCTVTISKPELPDHNKIAAFYNAVGAIPTKGDLADRWELIATAIDVYSGLNDAEKQASSEYFTTLQARIAEYNADIAKLNGEKTNADNDALKGIMG